MQNSPLQELRFELWTIALSALLLFVYSLDYRAHNGIILNTKGAEPFLYFMGGVVIWLVMCVACIGFAVAWGWLDFTEMVDDMRWFYVATLGVMWLVVVGMVGGVLSVFMMPLLMFGLRGLLLYSTIAAGIGIGVYQVFYPSETMPIRRVRVLTIAMLILCAGCVGNIALAYWPA